MALASAIVTNIRALTDHDTDTQVTDPQLFAWISTEYFAIRRTLNRVVPTLYVNTVSFTISSGNTYTIVATDFESIRRLQRLAGDSTYYAVKQASPLDPELARSIAFLKRGSVLEFYPSQAATGSYKLTYMTKPTQITAGGDTVDVPEGVDEVIAQKVSAKVRTRLNDSPTVHMEAADALWKEAKRQLQRDYGIHRLGLIESSEDN